MPRNPQVHHPLRCGIGRLLMSPRLGQPLLTGLLSIRRHTRGFSRSSCRFPALGRGATPSSSRSGQTVRVAHCTRLSLKSQALMGMILAHCRNWAASRFDPKRQTFQFLTTFVGAVSNAGDDAKPGDCSIFQQPCTLVQVNKMVRGPVAFPECDAMGNRLGYIILGLPCRIPKGKAFGQVGGQGAR